MNVISAILPPPLLTQSVMQLRSTPDAVGPGTAKILMNVGYFVAGVSSKASGLATAVTGWANAVSEHTPSQVTLYTVDCANKGFTDFEIQPPAQLVREPGSWWFRLNASSALRARIQRDADQIELFHNHCIWTLPSYYAYAAATQSDKPLIITPHGALNEIALKRSRLKKAIMRWLFQSKVLGAANLFHALTQNEAQKIRATGIQQPIAIIPNGIDLPAEPDEAVENVLVNRFPAWKDKKLMLFLARLHPIKGLDYLIPVWAKMAAEFPDWHLVLAGPDGGQQSWIEDQLAQQDLQQHVTLTGPLYGQQKVDAFRAASCFVLPSYSEGFSMTVLEAMGYRCPVIISDQCNFEEVLRKNAGYICQTNEASLSLTMRKIVAAGENERKLMGENGRKMIERDYSWPQVALKMEQVYRWLSGGPKPTHVEIV